MGQEADRGAAWRELEDAVDAALWRYAEAVTGHPRTVADGSGAACCSPRASWRWRGRKPPGGCTGPRWDAADRSAAALARTDGASYPMLQRAGMAVQPAWRRYKPAVGTPLEAL